MIDDDSLLGNTVARLDHISDVSDLLVVCNEDHRFMVAGVLQSRNRLSGASIILEPVGRNTAPAIALAAMQARNTDKDAILLVMPADHVIKESSAFAAAVEKAASAARSGKLVTFGIVPDRPHTGYGYIKAGEQNGDWSTVAEFVEKPDLESAEAYVRDGNYYWNSGMFVFRADRYLEELQKFRPDILTCAEEAFNRGVADQDFIRVDRDAFEKSPKDSIDYAVMEKTGDAVVVPLDAGWSDVGSWSALWEINDHDEQGNVCRGDVLVEGVTNSYIHSESRLVTAIGVDSHVIVETDDVVLVADKSRVEEVKQLVEQVKNQGRQEHHFHKKVHRPWGTYEGIAISDRFQVKRIMVKPGAKLSLQKHHHRSEHWVVVSGSAIVTRGEEEMLLTENQYAYIPLGEIHRLANPGVIPLEIIEVQTGAYLGEDDIVRFEDTYGRVK